MLNKDNLRKWLETNDFDDLPRRFYHLLDKDFPEKWLKIWANEKYEVSSHGRVRNGKRGNILKQRKKKTKYMYVKLCTKESKKEHLVHRIVCRKFGKGYDETKHVNHKDKKRWNNTPFNTEFLTPKQNMQHKVGNKQYLNY